MTRKGSRKKKKKERKRRLRNTPVGNGEHGDDGEGFVGAVEPGTLNQHLGQLRVQGEL